MTKIEFVKLMPGDRVRYSGATVTVKCWLEPCRFIEYENGQNTKISDPWLSKMRVLKNPV